MFILSTYLAQQVALFTDQRTSVSMASHGHFKSEKKIIINTSPDYIAHIFNLWSTVGGED